MMLLFMLLKDPLEKKFLELMMYSNLNSNVFKTPFKSRTSNILTLSYTSPGPLIFIVIQICQYKA